MCCTWRSDGTEKLLVLENVGLSKVEEPISDARSGVGRSLKEAAAEDAPEVSM